MNIVLDCQVCVQSSCRGPGSRLTGAHLSAGSGKGSKGPELSSNRPRNQKQPRTRMHTHPTLQGPCHLLVFCFTSSVLFGPLYHIHSIQQPVLAQTVLQQHPGTIGYRGTIRGTKRNSRVDAV